MKHWHNGRITKCGKEFGIALKLNGPSCPLFIIQWLDNGYYFGWIDDNFWNELKIQGRVGPKYPWWHFW